MNTDTSTQQTAKGSLCSSWSQQVGGEFQKTYMKDLKQFLVQERGLKKVIYPKADEIFTAFNLAPFEKTKVVIIGQDPYHGPDQAHGLCFSVKPGIKSPPSLVNIYKELQIDLGITPPNHGFLSHWAKQGVLLLNAVLTVEAGQAGSHAKKGWESFTDKCIEQLNHNREHLVFILWGRYAADKGKNIDASKHLILKSAHPSPLSAYQGFFGSRPFSAANKYLAEHGIEPVDWSLPELSQ